MESDGMHFKGDVVFERIRRRNDLGNTNEEWAALHFFPYLQACGMSAVETKAGGLQG